MSHFDPLAALASIVTSSDEGLTVGDVENLALLHTRLGALMATDARLAAALTAPMPDDNEGDCMVRLGRAVTAVATGQWLHGTVDPILARYVAGGAR